jgi:peptide/nickel transport system permease protein
MAERGRRSDPPVVTLIVLGLVVVFAFVGPHLWRYGPGIHREIPSDAAPSWAHPFGTDRAGRDLLAEVQRGTQVSLLVALLATAIATAAGTTVGLLAGYFGRWVDAVSMRFVDVLLIVPTLVIVIVVAGAVEGTTWVRVAVTLGLLSWMRLARVVRGLAVELRHRDFIAAARALGGSDAHIIGRHLLPNLAGAIAVDAAFIATQAVLAEAALSFLGFGLAAPDTSLGALVSAGQSAMVTRPWLFYVPGAFLVIVCVVIHAIGETLRARLSER